MGVKHMSGARPMGSDCALTPEQDGQSWPQRCRQPSVRELGFVGSAVRRLPAASAGALWQLEERACVFTAGPRPACGDSVRLTCQRS